MSPKAQDAIAVSAEGISKRFRLSPRPSIKGRPRSAWRTIQEPAGGTGLLVDDDEDDEISEDREELDEEAPTGQPGHREIWALRDISFTAAVGSIMGVGGPAGAGKTTLLRVLGRTTPPTEGRATIKGRVSPPVETASRFFEPERTGRQNVLDVADVFGIPRTVAHRQLDEIFRFAALERFIDVELIRYSRGYLGRLAFSTVVNLEPAVLLADGLPGRADPEFRERSLERIMERRAAGMTVIMATSDPKLLRGVCDSAIWLDEGRIVAAGSGEEVADLSVAQGAQSLKRTLKRLGTERQSRERVDGSNTEEGVERAGPGRPATARKPPPRGQARERRNRRKTAARQQRTGQCELVIADAGVYSPGGERLSRVETQDEALLRILVQVERAPAELRCKVALRRGKNRHLRISQPTPARIDAPGTYEASVRLPAGSLTVGAYTASVTAEIASGDERTEVLLRSAFSLEASGAGDPAGRARKGERSDLPWSISVAARQVVDEGQ